MSVFGTSDASSDSVRIAALEESVAQLQAVILANAAAADGAIVGEAGHRMTGDQAVTEVAQSEISARLLGDQALSDLIADEVTGRYLAVQAVIGIASGAAAQAGAAQDSALRAESTAAIAAAANGVHGSRAAGEAASAAGRVFFVTDASGLFASGYVRTAGGSDPIVFSLPGLARYAQMEAAVAAFGTIGVDGVLQTLRALRVGGEFAQVPSAVSDQFIDALVDADSKVLIGITPKGKVYLVREDEDAMPLPGYIEALLDASDRLVLGIMKDGRVDLLRHNEELIDSFFAGIEPVLDIDDRCVFRFEKDGTTFFDASPDALALLRAKLQLGGGSVGGAVTGYGLLTPARALVNTWDAATIGGRPAFRSDAEGRTYPYIKRADIASDTVLRADVDPYVVMHHAHGQSNSRNADAVLLTATPPAPYMAVTFDKSGTIGNGGAVMAAGNAFWPTDFVPAIEVGGESILSAAGAYAAYLAEANNDRRHIFLCRSHGLGGTAIAGLSKGTGPYNNGVIEAQRAVAIATAYGMSGARCYLKPWIQGEQDVTAPTSYATYKAAQIQLAIDMDADWRGALGQAEPVRTGIHQLAAASNVTPTDTAYLPIARAQLDAWLARPDLIVMVCPLYWARYSPNSSVHRVAESRRGEGEYYEIKERAVRLGLDTTPLYITAGARADNIITLTYSRSGLTFAPTAIGGFTMPMHANQGFHVFDAGGVELAVAGVAIPDAATNLVVITLVTTPTTAISIIYAGYAPMRFDAGTRPSAWGNLRTIAGPASLHFPGEIRPDFALVQQIGIA